MSRGWAKASACCLQTTLSCAFLCHIVSLQYLSSVVSPSLGWSPLSSFLVIWSPTGDTRGPSVVFEAVDMPCPGPFHFSYSVDYIYDFCPLHDPDVGLSVFVCDVEHTSFHFCLCIHVHKYDQCSNLSCATSVICKRPLVLEDHFHSHRHV